MMLYRTIGMSFEFSVIKLGHLSLYLVNLWFDFVPNEVVFCCRAEKSSPKMFLNWRRFLYLGGINCTLHLVGEMQLVN
jgi:hypothetical protein